MELTREIARRFNYYYGEVFPEPQPILSEVPRLPGLDGRKMSKSYNNILELDEPWESVEKKVLKISPHHRMNSTGLLKVARQPK